MEKLVDLIIEGSTSTRIAAFAGKIKDLNSVDSDGRNALYFAALKGFSS